MAFDWGQLIAAAIQYYGQQQHDNQLGDSKPVPLTPEQQWQFNQIHDQFNYNPAADYSASYGNQFLQGLAGGAGSYNPVYHGSQYQNGYQATKPFSFDFSNMPQWWKPGYQRPSGLGDLGGAYTPVPPNGGGSGGGSGGGANPNLGSNGTGNGHPGLTNNQPLDPHMGRPRNDVIAGPWDGGDTFTSGPTMPNITPAQNVAIQQWVQAHGGWGNVTLGALIQAAGLLGVPVPSIVTYWHATHTPESGPLPPSTPLPAGSGTQENP